MKTIRRTSFIVTTLFALFFMVCCNPAWAQEKASPSTHDLAKQSQNPVSSLISVPVEMNLNFNSGPEDVNDFITNIKPVVPMQLSENWNLINRVIMPLVSQGKRGPGMNNREFGLGDFTYQGFITPAKPGKVIWGVGPQLGLPTGMDRHTSNQWTLGPSALFVMMPGHWVFGGLVSNSWNIGNGYDDAPNVNMFSAQYFINYNMKGGWYLSTAPTITANWKADSRNKWTVPFGGGVGRVFKIGKQHVNMKLASYYNVKSPDDTSNWSMQFSCTFLFPK